MRTGGLVRSVARLGRVTYEDAVDLASVFAQVASRQARDTLVATRSQLTHARTMPRRARRRGSR